MSYGEKQQYERGVGGLETIPPPLSIVKGLKHGTYDETWTSEIKDKTIIDYTK